jgi:hypothetical protein
MESTFAHRWIRKFRILTLCLIFSGALNIGAIAVALTFLIQDRQDALSYPVPQVGGARGFELTTNQKLLGAYAHLTFRELAALLTNSDSVEEGYRKRDLALSALVSKHHFHLEKALGSLPPQVRVLETEEGSYSMFPGLTDDQFKAVIRFAYLEKWPLTGKGLFTLLQKSPVPRDPTLAQAFSLMPEFHCLNTLFQKCDITPSDLIDLASEGSWQILEGFVLEQSQMLDLSEERRRRLLLSHLALKSPAASRLLVQTDFAFALKRLDDKGILDLLQCSIGSDSALVQKFSRELLKSTRSDAIWYKSAELLYRAAGEEMQSPFDRSAALARFAPGAEAVKKPLILQAEPRPTILAKKHHIVQDGENLWKIARLYKVKVDQLVSINGLEKETIQPGMMLQLP